MWLALRGYNTAHPVSSDAATFDVYITASGSDGARRGQAEAVCGMYPLDGSRKAALLRGERVLLRGKLSPDQSERTIGSVQPLGVRVDLEAHEDGEDLRAAEPSSNPKPVPQADALGSMFNLSAGLVGLDGNDEGESLVAPPPVVPRGRAAPPPPPRVAAPPPPVPAPPTDRFRPTGHDSGSMEIQIDRPPPDPMFSEGTPRDQAKFEAPRCTTHDIPKLGGRCARCDAQDAALRGRFFQGNLRKNPSLRIGIGLVGGLVLGWIVTAPMARRAERQVDYIREEARREHLRPLEAAQAHAVQLDTQAEDEASSAFMRTLGIWGVITAAVTGAWVRLT